MHYCQHMFVTIHARVCFACLSTLSFLRLEFVEEMRNLRQCASLPRCYRSTHYVILPRLVTRIRCHRLHFSLRHVRREERAISRGDIARRAATYYAFSSDSFDDGYLLILRFR